MPDSNITPLRQRMIDDMSLRKLGEKTQTGYIRAVKRLTRHLGRAPDTATPEDLRLFQKHLVEQGVSSQTINATITGLRFFFEVTLDQPGALRRMSRLTGLVECLSWGTQESVTIRLRVATFSLADVG